MARVRIYSTPWCGYCTRLKSQMLRHDIDFEDINIETDPAAASFVMQHNQGNQTVPTVVLPDGTVVTNPPISHVVAAVESFESTP